jgi:hypothetical protein
MAYVHVQHEIGAWNSMFRHSAPLGHQDAPYIFALSGVTVCYLGLGDVHADVSPDVKP